MNESLEKVKAEFDEYLQLAQLKDFMSAVSELLDKKDIELAHLREIAACFESADSQTAMLMIDCKETHRGRYPEYYEILEIGFLSRMEKAARLAEDLCK